MITWLHISFFLMIIIIDKHKVNLVFQKGSKPDDHLLYFFFFFSFSWTVCQPPYQPENGGYTCHPSSCGRLSHGTVIEYFCDEGYVLKGDYKYLTCQYGEWDSQVKLTCLLEHGKQNQITHFVCLNNYSSVDTTMSTLIRLTDSDPSLPLEMPALSIVESTTTFVALILFLVVLFVLVQPKLKSLHRWVCPWNHAYIIPTREAGRCGRPSVIIKEVAS